MVDTGVYKTILYGTDWKVLREADPNFRPKLCKVKFTRYGTQDIIRRTKKILRNEE